MLCDELVLPYVDGLVPVGLAVPHPDVPLHQHGLAQQHNLRIGWDPSPGGVKDVDELLNVLLYGEHVLQHHAQAKD